MEKNLLNTSKHVIFQLKKEYYSISISFVERVIAINDEIKIRHIPNTKEEVIGIIPYQGENIPLIDLQIKFKEKRNPTTIEKFTSYDNNEFNSFYQYVILCKIEGETIGILVNEVISVKETENVENLKDSTFKFSFYEESYIEGIWRTVVSKKTNIEATNTNEELIVILNIFSLLDKNQ